MLVICSLSARGLHWADSHGAGGFVLSPAAGIVSEGGMQPRHFIHVFRSLSHFIPMLPYELDRTHFLDEQLILDTAPQ